MSNSYKQILRSSSIIGGAQALNYLIALVRVKVVAVLLGPGGVGLVSLYTSAMGLIGTVSSLGIGSSAVREVVQAYSKENAEQAARTVRILRRACWATGVLGWMLALVLAKPVSQWMVGTPEHAWAVAVLGVTLMIGAVSGGQLALLQGLRRIGDLAKANVLGVLVSTVVSIGLYAWLGQNGVVPVMVVSAVISMGFSYWFARRVPVAVVDVSWTETAVGVQRLASLGVAFMWSGILMAGLDLLTRSIISRQLGLEAAGIYQAAWALSGLFAGFILGAMGADFYPRLTAVIHDRPLAVRVVNEQTEIGILLALPGLLATLAIAPLMMDFFYTKRFMPGAELLPWMVLGVFGRVISWPVGFIQVAMGKSRWFIGSETIFIGIQATMVFWLVPMLGLIGAAYAFALANLLHVASVLWIGRELIGFSWSGSVIKLVCLTTGLVVLGLVVRLLVPGSAGMASCGILAVMACAVSMRGLAARLGKSSQWVKWISAVPGGRWVLGL